MNSTTDIVERVWEAFATLTAFERTNGTCVEATTFLSALLSRHGIAHQRVGGTYACPWDESTGTTGPPLHLPHAWIVLDNGDYLDPTRDQFHPHEDVDLLVPCGHVAQATWTIETAATQDWFSTPCATDEDVQKVVARYDEVTSVYEGFALSRIGERLGFQVTSPGWAGALV